MGSTGFSFGGAGFEAVEVVSEGVSDAFAVSEVFVVDAGGRRPPAGLVRGGVVFVAAAAGGFSVFFDPKTVGTSGESAAGTPGSELAGFFSDTVSFFSEPESFFSEAESVFSVATAFFSGVAALLVELGGGAPAAVSGFVLMGFVFG